MCTCINTKDNMSEENKDIIMNNSKVKACLYLIDTGFDDEGGNRLYKFGRTSNIKVRMNNHIRTWPKAKIIHIEPVTNVNESELNLIKMCKEYLYIGKKYNQRELLSGNNSTYFVQCMKTIAKNECQQEEFTPSKLFLLHNNLTKQLSEQFDMTLDGKKQRKFYKKYSLLFYHLMVYLICTQFTSTPMFITLKKETGHNMYYCEQGLFNGNILIPLTPLQHMAIQGLIEEHPNRIYLFSPSNIKPSDLSLQDRKSIINHFNRLLKGYNPNLKPSMYRKGEYKEYLMSLLLYNKLKTG